MKARSVLAAALLVCAACSRSGTLSGDVVVQVPPGKGNPAARLSIRAVPATAAFERDWAAALTAFQEELESARRAAQEAAAAVDQAKLAWDRALAAPHGRRRDPRAASRERDLWRQVLAAQQRMSAARRREGEVAHRHNLRAVALLERHTAQEVRTDGTGHYVMGGLPAGATYLYARVTAGERTVVWLHRVQVRAGVQQVNLTEANSGHWPFGL